MSSRDTTIGEFEKTYVTMRFERAGLFELIADAFQPQEVLYPGCATHITPACFFPHTVFVDRDPGVCEFFADRETILDWVERHKKYRRRPYIAFIHQDFTTPLPIRQGQFDLLLALYTGGIARACKAYLKPGGLLVTNNHQNDAVEAERDKQLSLMAVAQKRGDKYRLVDRDPGEHLRSKGRGSRSRHYLRRASSGLEYVEDESYYIFERERSRR